MGVTKVLFIAQEIEPYLPASEIATVCRNLPQGIQERGREIRTFMPKYGGINERRNQLHEVIRLSGMNLIIDDTDHPLIIKVASIQSARMQVYFIDNDDYFLRKGGETMEDEDNREDNDERAIFFVRGVMETVKKLRWTPDIIHCHGWMTALTPLYIKKAYAEDPSFQHSKVIYSVYDRPFGTPFNPNFANKLLLDGVELSDLPFQPDTEVNFDMLNRLAIQYADGVIQASPTIQPGLQDFAQANNIPFLGYQSPEEYIDRYNQFYNEILGDSQS